MDLHPDDPAFDPETQQRHDRRRLFRALNLSLAFVLLLFLYLSYRASRMSRAYAAPLNRLNGILLKHKTTGISLLSIMTRNLSNRLKCGFGFVIAKTTNA